MTSLPDSLRAIGTGRESAAGLLLQSCRFEGLGVRASGREAILGSIRRGPVELSPTAVAAESSTGFAFFGSDAVSGAPTAFFADRFGEAIGRLWYLSDAEPIGSPEVSLSVASDVDLDQRGAGVQIEAADHPDLSDVDADHVRGIAARVVTGLLEDRFSLEEVSLLRARAFVRRAFSDGPGGAALLGIDAVTAGSLRKPLRFNVAVLFDRQGKAATSERIVIDHAGFRAALRADWLPRIGSPSAGCADAIAG